MNSRRGWNNERGTGLSYGSLRPERNGGIISGPDSGYMAGPFHGIEAVTPLEKPMSAHGGSPLAAGAGGNIVNITGSAYDADVIAVAAQAAMNGVFAEAGSY